MGQVLVALASIHAKGIVHRDLKPENILVSDQGGQPFAKILDFGVGAFVNASQDPGPRMEIWGTPAYSAPEQLLGGPPTVKSDLYAWGLLFLECLTGTPIIQGESIADIYLQQLDMDEVPLPCQIVQHPIASLLRAVLEKDVNFRMADTSAMLEAYTQIDFHTVHGKINQKKATPTYLNNTTMANPLLAHSLVKAN